MSATRKEVYDAIDTERAYQEYRWDDSDSTVGEFVLYMEDYVAQARTELTRGQPIIGELDALHTLRKIAALAVAAMEQHGAPVRGPVPS